MSVRKVEPLPVHLQELLELLEAQTEPDRRAAIRTIEERHGVHVELAEAMEHEEFAVRYGRWLDGIDMALEDKSLSNALKGTASASTILRGRGLLNGGRGGSGPSGGDNGRIVLGRPSRTRAEVNRRRW